MVDVAGNPFFIETPLDLELARAQLARMHFHLSPDPDTGRFTLVPANLDPDIDPNPMCVSEGDAALVPTRYRSKK